MQSLRSPWFKRISETCIRETCFSKEQICQSSNQLTERAVGQLNWVSGITRLDISFLACDASTRFKNSTVADAFRVNEII